MYEAPFVLISIVRVYYTNILCGAGKIDSINASVHLAVASTVSVLSSTHENSKTEAVRNQVFPVQSFLDKT